MFSHILSHILNQSLYICLLYISFAHPFNQDSIDWPQNNLQLNRSCDARKGREKSLKGLDRISFGTDFCIFLRRVIIFFVFICISFESRESIMDYNYYTTTELSLNINPTILSDLLANQSTICFNETNRFNISSLPKWYGF